MKTCNRCKTEQPEVNFSKDSRAPDGLQYVCRKCATAHKKVQYAANPERYKDRVKARYVANPDKVNAAKKAWRDANPDAVKARNKARYAASTESERAYAREGIKAWKAANPDKVRAMTQKRRAMKVGIVSTLTIEQWNHILDVFNNTCAYCGAGDKKLHQEHFIPLSAGGEYTHDNIIPACYHCNTSKGARDFFTWYPAFHCYDKQREKNVMRFLHYTGATQQLTLCT